MEKQEMKRIVDIIPSMKKRSSVSKEYGSRVRGEESGEGIDRKQTPPHGASIRVLARDGGKELCFPHCTYNAILRRVTVHDGGEVQSFSWAEVTKWQMRGVRN
jgi:hypothetical protein